MKYVASLSFGKDSFNTFRPNTTLKDLEERFKNTQIDYLKESGE